MPVKIIHSNTTADKSAIYVPRLPQTKTAIMGTHAADTAPLTYTIRQFVPIQKNSGGPR